MDNLRKNQRKSKIQSNKTFSKSKTRRYLNYILSKHMNFLKSRPISPLSDDIEEKQQIRNILLEHHNFLESQSISSIADDFENHKFKTCKFHLKIFCEKPCLDCFWINYLGC